MKRWKPILLFVFILAILFYSGNSLFGAAPFSKPSAKRNIVYIYKTTLGEIEFWRSITDGIKTGAKEYGFTYTILGPREEWDVQGNITALRRAIAQKPDIIVLAATDHLLLQEAAQEAVEAGIPLMTLDSNVAGDSPRCFIGTNNYQIGWQMAQELQKRIPAGSKVGVIGHIEGTFTAIERIRGAREGLQALGGSVLLEPVYTDNLINRAKEETLALLRDNPDLAGLIATNERSAIGMCEAIVQAGVQDRVVSVTCDHSSGQIAYLERGIIDATIVQKPFNMGYFSVQMASKLLQDFDDPSVPAFYDTGYEVITVENYFTLENQKLLFPFWE